MRTDLQEAMTAGVLIEFRDAAGHTLGQAVFTAWQGRPLPTVGDTIACTVRDVATGRDRKLSGCVLARTFDVQHDDQGPCVWAHVVAQAPVPGRVARRGGRQRVSFSAN